jgi:hypothetical protein
MNSSWLLITRRSPYGSFRHGGKVRKKSWPAAKKLNVGIS